MMRWPTAARVEDDLAVVKRLLLGAEAQYRKETGIQPDARVTNPAPAPRRQVNMLVNSSQQTQGPSGTGSNPQPVVEFPDDESEYGEGEHLPTRDTESIDSNLSSIMERVASGQQQILALLQGKTRNEALGGSSTISLDLTMGNHA